MGHPITTFKGMPVSGITLDARALDAWLALKQWTNDDLARGMRVSPSYISMVLSRQRNPGMKFITRLLKVSGVPFDTFFKVAGARRGSRRNGHGTAAARRPEGDGATRSSARGGKRLTQTARPSVAVTQRP